MAAFGKFLLRLNPQERISKFLPLAGFETNTCCHPLDLHGKLLHKDFPSSF